MTILSKTDLLQIEQHGLCVEAVEHQFEDFRRGFPSLPVVRAASPGDGIRVLNGKQVLAAAAHYDRAAAQLKVVKFVPASGAATRMFKELFEFLGDGKVNETVKTVVEHISEFAFWSELLRFLPAMSDDEMVVRAIVGSDGLGYGAKPKGLVSFHAYPEQVRNAAEEHLVEGAVYASAQGVVRIHFTVSPEHMEDFRTMIAQKAPLYEETYGVYYEVTFSVQKSATDTIAVNPDNTPFRTDAGELLFRPAGHGALIENLNDIDADVIFIKNIDNVTTDARRGDTVRYKKALAGVLLSLQQQAFDHLRALDAGLADLHAVADFIEQELCVKLPAGCDATLMRDILDRPMRVCGMVCNEGEPGGGPFHVANADGTQSLQIAEPNQIAPSDLPLMRSATHFNPVDLVCGVRTWRGAKFDLRDYCDPSTGFVSTKSSGGRALRALELPGLWNGAMARWNTIFVEVPVTTFSPVKTVLDLLRPQHR